MAKAAKTKNEIKYAEAEKAAASAYKDANKASKLASRLLAKADKLAQKASKLGIKVREEARADEGTGEAGPSRVLSGPRWGC